MQDQPFLFVESLGIFGRRQKTVTNQMLLRSSTSNKDGFILIPRDSKPAKERNRGLSGFFSKTRVLLRCAYASRSIGYAVHLPEPVEIDDLHGSLD
jgi:hypothetical protein